jgi:Ca2+/Na+ antiporter
MNQRLKQRFAVFSGAVLLLVLWGAFVRQSDQSLWKFVVLIVVTLLYLVFVGAIIKRAQQSKDERN